MTYLNSTQLQRVQQCLPLYLEGQRRIGVPWVLLAAIHYRESNFNTVASRVGGAFQFDPPLQPAQVRAYGAKYAISDLTDPETDLRTGALCSAAFLQAKAAELRTRVALPTAVPVTPEMPVVIAPTPASVQKPTAVGRLLLADPAGKFGEVSDKDLIYGNLYFSRKADGSLWAWPTRLPVPPPTNPAWLLLADQAGQFVVAPAGDFVYQGQYFSQKPNGDLWVRPATPAELT